MELSPRGLFDFGEPGRARRPGRNRSAPRDSEIETTADGGRRHRIEPTLMKPGSPMGRRGSDEGSIKNGTLGAGALKRPFAPPQLMRLCKLAPDGSAHRGAQLPVHRSGRDPLVKGAHAKRKTVAMLGASLATEASRQQLEARADSR
jgi:hypothetical protein